MARNNQFDPGYFGAQNAGNQYGQQADTEKPNAVVNRQVVPHEAANFQQNYANQGFEQNSTFQQYNPTNSNQPYPQQNFPRKVRKPGFDAGSILWPFLFTVVFFATQILAQLLFMVLRMASDRGLMQQYTNAGPAEMQEFIIQIIYQDFAKAAILYSVVQIIIFSIFLIVKNKREKNYVLTRPGRPLDWAGGITLMGAALGIATLWFVSLSALAESIPGVKDMMDNYSEMAQMFQVKDGILIQAIAVAVLVPITEELLFRGIFMAELRRFCPEWLAILLNALLFAIFHFNVVQSVYVIFAGLALGAAYVWSESLWVPIGMHMFYNFFGSIFAQIVPIEGNGELIYNIAIGVVSLIGIGLAILMYKKRHRPYKKPIDVLIYQEQEQMQQR